VKHLLSYLKKFFWRYRWRFLLGTIFVGLANTFRVWQPKVIGQALDTVIERVRFYKEHGGIEAHPEAFSELGRQIALFGAAVIGLAILMGLFMYFMRQTIIVMSRLIEYDMRKEIFAHYTKLDLAFYKRNSTGDMMSRISEDVSKVRMFLGPTILYGLDLIFLFILAISSMLSVSVELTLWSLLPLPFLSLSIYWVSSIINKRSEKIQQQLAVLTSEKLCAGKSYGPLVCRSKRGIPPPVTRADPGRCFFLSTHVAAHRSEYYHYSIRRRAAGN
jgi:ATP-binding cassette subfamily B protein